MIVRDLRLGSKAIIRIYRNGVIIWEGGRVYTAAQLISVLTGFALVDTDYPVPIQMDADINAETVGKPFATDANASAYGKAELIGNVTPQPADTINRRADTKSILTAIASPLSALYIWCRGKLAMAFGTKGTPQPADTVNGAGETTANLTEQAAPIAQGITKMLFSTEGEESGYILPVVQDAYEPAVKMGAFGELALIGQPVVKNVCDVTFVVNGKVEHQTTVLEGEAPSDPAADGTIEDTTKESTAQYHFHYAGWSRTEDGEPLDDLTVTEDTVFYAVYDKELRYYTIGFYDGETLHESKSVAYGDIPSATNPEKDGYMFDGWLPEIVAVTGDAEYYAAWIDMTGYVAYGTCGDDAIWTLDGDGKLTISGTGEMAATGYAAQPWKSYKSQILAVEVKEGITGIGMNSFYQHTNLASVSLPDSLTVINRYAFFKCTKLTSIIIPAEVAEIEYWAFQNSGLTSAIFEQTSGWKITDIGTHGHSSIDRTVDVSSATTAATYLKTTYATSCFYRT